MLDNNKPKLHFERFEFKYWLGEYEAERVLRAMRLNNLEWDPNVSSTGDHSYSVTSLYYDSPRLKCYDDKISGIGIRFKLRERIYTERLASGDPVFYEVKKKNDAVIIKDRQAGSPSHEFEHKRLRYNLTPKLLITYKRKALQGKFQERLRVTFDSDLKAVQAKSLVDFDEPAPIASGIVVMEVKFNNTLPRWFKKIIVEHELDRRPFSKYCVGVEAHTGLLLQSGLYRNFDQKIVSGIGAFV